MKKKYKMNFKKYYINGNRFTFTFRFSGERYWNDFMYWLTRMSIDGERYWLKITKKEKIDETK